MDLNKLLSFICASIPISVLVAVIFIKEMFKVDPIVNVGGEVSEAELWSKHLKQRVILG